MSSFYQLKIPKTKSLKFIENFFTKKTWIPSKIVKKKNSQLTKWK